MEDDGRYNLRGYQGGPGPGLSNKKWIIKALLATHLGNTYSNLRNPMIFERRLPWQTETNGQLSATDGFRKGELVSGRGIWICSNYGFEELVISCAGAYLPRVPLRTTGQKFKKKQNMILWWEMSLLLMYSVGYCSSYNQVAEVTLEQIQQQFSVRLNTLCNSVWAS